MEGVLRPLKPSIISLVRNAVSAFLFVMVTPALLLATEQADILQKLKALEEQNAQLLQLVQEQQRQINELGQRLESTEAREKENTAEIEELQDREYVSESSSFSPGDFLESKIHLSGEAGVVFFAGESNHQFANEEFRVDEARLFVEAEVAEDIYFFSSLFLFNRDMAESDVFVGGTLCGLGESLWFRKPRAPLQPEGRPVSHPFRAGVRLPLCDGESTHFPFHPGHHGHG